MINLLIKVNFRILCASGIYQKEKRYKLQIFITLKGRIYANYFLKKIMKIMIEDESIGKYYV
jgi:hypothetical protein